MSNIVHCPLIEWYIVIAKSHKLVNGITELPNHTRALYRKRTHCE